MDRSDLDVVTLGMMMAEISPPRLGVRIAEAESLVLFPAGSATIFCVALARLGGRVGLISKVGEDEIGRWMLRTLQEQGIDTGAIGVVPGQLTPLSLASVDERGNKSFAYYRFAGTCDPLATLSASDVDDAYLARGRVFDLTEGSLRSPGLRDVSLELARRARGLGRVVCFNPNYRARAWAGGADEARRVLREALALADLTIMNEAEARLIAGEPSVTEAARWLAAAGPAIVVVTRGREPTLVVAEGEVTEVPAFDVEVVYDIGAGDVFHAGFLAVWRPGTDPRPCAAFAAAAAAVKIGRPPQLEQLPDRAATLAFLRARGVDTGWLAGPDPPGDSTRPAE